MGVRRDRVRGLAYAFYVNDFSVLYVAQNSNSALPTFYRFAAVWGAHEGSLLLWLLVLATWTLARRGVQPQPARTFAARVLGVLGFVSVGFLLFILFTSNPFERLLPAAVDGRDLNPLLQDPRSRFIRRCSTSVTSVSRWRSRSPSRRCSKASST